MRFNARIFILKNFILFFFTHRSEIIKGHLLKKTIIPNELDSTMKHHLNIRLTPLTLDNVSDDHLSCFLNLS